MLQLLAPLFLTVAPTQAPTLESQTLENGSTIEYQTLVAADGSRIRNGTFTLTSADGIKLVSGEYKDGLRDGTWRYRHASGKPWINGTFRDGLRDGKWNFRHANGKARATGMLEAGLPHGKWTFKDETGQPDPDNSGLYEALVSRRTDGSLEYSGATLDGSPHGRWLFEWPAGAKQLEAEFRRGKRAGTWHFWHADGTYDSWMLSGDHGAGAFFREFDEEPLALGEAETASSDVIPARTALPSTPSDSAQRALEATYGDYRNGDSEQRNAARKTLIASGRPGLGVLLDELIAQDLSLPASADLASSLLQDLVEPILAGNRLLAADRAPTPDELKLAVLRAHSLYFVTSKSIHWWALDLVAGSPLVADDSSPLAQPTVLAEALYGQQISSGPYAMRFGEHPSPRTSGERGTEEALQKALTWLARNQQADGRWLAADPYHDLGVTALALLALMGDGNTPSTGHHQDAVRRGFQWILKDQHPSNGLLRKFVPVTDPDTGETVMYHHTQFFYDHGVATLALCELASLSNSPRVRRSAQAAINYIVLARNPYGTWRYDVPPRGDNDSSVTGWMLAALCAARQAGLKIDERALHDCISWFDEVTDPKTGRVGYSQMGEASAREPRLNTNYPLDNTETITALGLWSRFLLGQTPSEKQILNKHADLMLKRLPEWDERNGYSNDVYYWYFGTYAMHRMGGRHWSAWNKALKTAVLGSQLTRGEDAGSWKPNGPWSYRGGQVYATAMIAMCLESYFRFDDAPK